MVVTPQKGAALDRTEVRLAAWIAVATSNSCMSNDVATNWADHCLKEFDKRFPSPPPEPRQTSKEA